MRWKTIHLIDLLALLPFLAIFLIWSDEAGLALRFRHSPLITRERGDLHIVPAGSLQPGASIYWYLVLDHPTAGDKSIEAGESVRLLDCSQVFAEVRILSGPHQGLEGWIGRSTLEPPWNHKRIVIGFAVLVSLFLVVAIVLLVRLLRFLVTHRSLR